MPATLAAFADQGEPIRVREGYFFFSAAFLNAHRFL